MREILQLEHIDKHSRHRVEFILTNTYVLVIILESVIVILTPGLTDFA